MTKAAAIIVTLLLVAPPAWADVTPEDLARAEAEMRRVSSRLDDESARLEEVVQHENEVRQRLGRLVIDLTARERELVLARRAARERVAEMYMSAGTDDAPTLFSVDLNELPAKVTYLETVSETDRSVVNQLETARANHLRQREALLATIAERQGARAEKEELLAQIYSELEEANARYQEVKAEWDRQEQERLRREAEERRRREAERRRLAEEAARRATTTTQAATTTTTRSTTTTTTTVLPPSSPLGMVCPVAGATTFSDTWGARRSGGRRHKGVDMHAVHGTPVVAIESGTIDRMTTGSLGGITVSLSGDSGHYYYYAHLDTWAAGLHAGQRVAAGEVIGTVGSSGNASSSSPHLHFQIRPPGSDWVNPYPIVRDLCR